MYRDGAAFFVHHHFPIADSNFFTCFAKQKNKTMKKLIILLFLLANAQLNAQQVMTPEILMTLKYFISIGALKFV